MAIRNESARRRRAAGPGRLSAAVAERLPGELLDAAQSVFVRHGYARATMDAIARAAGTTRKTLYARYANKAEVLDAVVDRLLERSLSAPARTDTPRAASAPPRAQLLALALELAELSAAPDVAGLNRLILAEAAQVPELARLFADLHARAARAVGDRLDAMRAAGRWPQSPVPGPQAAALFVEMACSLPRLHALLGRPMSARQRAAHARAAVDLFVAAHEPGSSA
jgi:TetR/AcrR family transcriptional regulator, mexJK operon transcriptional repressor